VNAAWLVHPVVLWIRATAYPVLAQTTLSLTGGLSRTTMAADPTQGACSRFFPFELPH